MGTKTPERKEREKEVAIMKFKLERTAPASGGWEVGPGAGSTDSSDRSLNLGRLDREAQNM